MPVHQKTKTFARTILRLTDADVIEIAQPQPMHREAASADLAGDFAERVKRFDPSRV